MRDFPTMSEVMPTTASAPARRGRHDRLQHRHETFGAHGGTSSLVMSIRDERFVNRGFESRITNGTGAKFHRTPWPAHVPQVTDAIRDFQHRADYQSFRRMPMCASRAS
jgi:hypothetical protein